MFNITIFVCLFKDYSELLIVLLYSFIIFNTEKKKKIRYLFTAQTKYFSFTIKFKTYYIRKREYNKYFFFFFVIVFIFSKFQKNIYIYNLVSINYFIF